MRETTEMLMKPNANWEEYLTPAPLSIAIMGELVFISSSDDFSINKNPQKVSVHTRAQALFQELLEARTNAGTLYKEELEKIKMKLEENKLREQSAKELNDRSKKAMEDMSKQSKAASGTPALTPKPPMMFKADNSSGGNSAGQRASENARFRIEQSQAQLKQVRQSYEKCVENMEKNQKELTDILVEMQNCKIKEVDFKTKIKMLVKGLDAMGRVKEQWEKMVLFFQMVSNIVKISLSKTMHNFVKTSEDTKKLSYNEKLFAKDQLYNQAFQASNVASLVHMISETYTEVSQQVPDGQSEQPG
ncbi:uncharacterized protein AKAME5_002244600 [Lates japonicus]|uniref:Uncharacterized protein n=1 Tax=Lates japonicus TaxID=270547 RepID=A0AAD3NET1_LATJO|nr:uncharacterized protein AKAME5_002244600 [Lates japonicus]